MLMVGLYLIDYFVFCSWIHVIPNLHIEFTLRCGDADQEKVSPWGSVQHTAATASWGWVAGAIPEPGGPSVWSQGSSKVAHTFTFLNLWILLCGVQAYHTRQTLLIRQQPDSPLKKQLAKRNVLERAGEQWDGRLITCVRWLDAAVRRLKTSKVTKSYSWWVAQWSPEVWGARPSCRRSAPVAALPVIKEK